MTVEDPKKIIGEALRFLRRQKGLTQEDISREIGIHRPTYSSWERGKAIPSVKILEALARIYDVSADDIMTGRYTPQPYEPPPLYSAESQALVALTALQILEDTNPEKEEIVTQLIADTLVGIMLLVYGDDAYYKAHHVIHHASFLATKRLHEIEILPKNRRPD